MYREVESVVGDRGCQMALVCEIQDRSDLHHQRKRLTVVVQPSGSTWLHAVDTGREGYQITWAPSQDQGQRVAKQIAPH